MSSESSTPTTTDQLRRYGPPAVLAVLALLFVVQNTHEARFNFLWLEFRWPLWVMLLVFAIVGAVIALLLARRRRRARR